MAILLFTYYLWKWKCICGLCICGVAVVFLHGEWRDHGSWDLEAMMSACMHYTFVYIYIYTRTQTHFYLHVCLWLWLRVCLWLSPACACLSLRLRVCTWCWQYMSFFRVYIQQMSWLYNSFDAISGKWNSNDEVATQS